MTNDLFCICICLFVRTPTDVVCRSNHSGNNGSSGSLPSSGGGAGASGGGGPSNGANGSSLNSDDANNGEYFNNNPSGGDNSLGSEVCDVPYEVANQKRHVSYIHNLQYVDLSMAFAYFPFRILYSQWAHSNTHTFETNFHFTHFEVNRFPKSQNTYAESMQHVCVHAKRVPSNLVNPMKIGSFRIHCFHMYSSSNSFFPFLCSVVGLLQCVPFVCVYAYSLPLY